MSCFTSLTRSYVSLASLRCKKMQQENSKACDTVTRWSRILLWRIYSLVSNASDALNIQATYARKIRIVFAYLNQPGYNVSLRIEPLAMYNSLDYGNPGYPVCACRCWISVINYPSNSRVIGGPGRTRCQPQERETLDICLGHRSEPLLHPYLHFYTLYACIKRVTFYYLLYRWLGIP